MTDENERLLAEATVRQDVRGDEGAAAETRRIDGQRWGRLPLLVGLALAAVGLAVAAFLALAPTDPEIPPDQPLPGFRPAAAPDPAPKAPEPAPEAPEPAPGPAAAEPSPAGASAATGPAAAAAPRPGSEPEAATKAGPAPAAKAPSRPASKPPSKGVPKEEDVLRSRD